MELKAKKPLIFFVTATWMVLVLTIGLWWLYLIVRLSEKADLLYKIKPELNQGINFSSLVLWEGSAFLALLLLASGTLGVLYFRDIRKTKSIQAFFASLTHELKTPLASMKLQAEVMNDHIKEKAQNETTLFSLSQRLLEDSSKLEIELDKILQLSRVELGGKLTTSAIELSDFFQGHLANYNPSIQIELAANESSVAADEFALSLIFKNLIENSLQHAKVEGPLKAKINWANEGDQVAITYSDNGTIFKGDKTKLGQLFYKYNSLKGSGIGLYLCKKLCLAMNGKLEISQNPGMQLKVFLPRASK